MWDMKICPTSKKLDGRRGMERLGSGEGAVAQFLNHTALN